MALEKYKQKRNFTSTPEPAGDTARRPARRRAAGRRASSACRSTSPATCTTTSGSSTTACCCRGRCRRGRRSIPTTKRLAMHVEDHPVRLRRRSKASSPTATAPASSCCGISGTWTPEVDDVDAALKKGDLKFTLDGFKLKGSWVLVRTERPAARAAAAGDEPQLAADQAPRRLGRRRRHHRVRAAQRQELRRFRGHPRGRQARRLAVAPPGQGRRGGQDAREDHRAGGEAESRRRARARTPTRRRGQQIQGKPATKAATPAGATKTRKARATKTKTMPARRPAPRQTGARRPRGAQE